MGWPIEYDIMLRFGWLTLGVKNGKVIYETITCSYRRKHMWKHEIKFAVIIFYFKSFIAIDEIKHFIYEVFFFFLMNSYY